MFGDITVFFIVIVVVIVVGDAGEERPNEFVLVVGSVGGVGVVASGSVHGRPLWFLFLTWRDGKDACLFPAIFTAFAARGAASSGVDPVVK